MNRDESLGLGAIHADDELLDRLGRRQEPSDDGIELLLASWTAAIDVDEQAMADRTGPLGLRGQQTQAAQTVVLRERTRPAPRTIRIPGSRAAAVAAALALTMSGGGVAAAMTGQDVPLVPTFISKALSVPVVPAEPTPTEKMDDVLSKAVENKLAAGQTQAAREIVQGMQAGLGPNSDPSLKAHIDSLDARVDQAMGAADPTATTTTSTTTTPALVAIAAPTTALGLPTSAVIATTVLTTGPLATSSGGASSDAMPIPTDTSPTSGSDDKSPHDEAKTPSGSLTADPTSPTDSPTQDQTATPANVNPSSTPSPSETPTKTDPATSTSSPTHSSPTSSHSTTSSSSDPTLRPRGTTGTSSSSSTPTGTGGTRSTSTSTPPRTSASSASSTVSTSSTAGAAATSGAVSMTRGGTTSDRSLPTQDETPNPTAGG